MKNQKVEIKYFKTGLLILFLISAFAAPIRAKESQIIGTVSVASETPLTLELSSRSSVFIFQNFNLKAELNNIGQNDVDEIILSLYLPIGLKLIKDSSNQDIGTIKAGKKKIVNWRIQGSKLGNYVVQVKANGIERNSNEEIEISDSQVIEARQKNFLIF